MRSTPGREVTSPQGSAWLGAGRVQGYGDPRQLQIVVRNNEGAVAGRAAVSAYGFFRTDNLKPGSYRIELQNAATGAAIASLPVTITDRFVFGRNFVAAQTEDEGSVQQQRP